MSLKGLVAALIQYHHEKDASAFNMIDIYKKQIKHDLLAAFEMSQPLVHTFPDLFRKSSSFIHFLLTLNDIQVPPPHDRPSESLPTVSPASFQEASDLSQQIDDLQKQLKHLTQSMQPPQREPTNDHQYDAEIDKLQHYLQTTEYKRHVDDYNPRQNPLAKLKWLANKTKHMIRTFEEQMDQRVDQMKTLETQFQTLKDKHMDLTKTLHTTEHDLENFKTKYDYCRDKLKTCEKNFNACNDKLDLVSSENIELKAKNAYLKGKYLTTSQRNQMEKYSEPPLPLTPTPANLSKASHAETPPNIHINFFNKPTPNDLFSNEPMTAPTEPLNPAAACTIPIPSTNPFISFPPPQENAPFLGRPTFAIEATADVVTSDTQHDLENQLCECKRQKEVQDKEIEVLRQQLTEYKMKTEGFEEVQCSIILNKLETLSKHYLFKEADTFMSDDLQSRYGETTPKKTTHLYLSMLDQMRILLQDYTARKHIFTLGSSENLLKNQTVETWTDATTDPLKTENAYLKKENDNLKNKNVNLNEEYEKQTNHLKEVYEKQKTALDNTIVDLKAEIEKYKNYYISKDEYDTVQSNYKTLLDQNNDLQQKHANIDEIRTSLANMYKDTETELRKQIADLYASKNIDTLVSDINKKLRSENLNLTTANAKLDGEVNTLKDQIQSLQNQRQDLEQQLAQKTKDLQTTQDEHAQYVKQYTEEQTTHVAHLQKQLENSLAAYQTLQNQQQRLKTLHDACNQLNVELESKIKHLTQQLQNEQKHYQQGVQQITNLKTEQETLEKDIQRLQTKKDFLQNEQDQLGHQVQNLKSEQEKLVHLEQQINTLEQQQLQKQTDLSTLEQQEQNLKRDVFNLEHQVQNLKIEQADLQHQKEQWQAAWAKEKAEIEMDRETHRHTLENQKTDLHTLETQKTDLQTTVHTSEEYLKQLALEKEKLSKHIQALQTEVVTVDQHKTTAMTQWQHDLYHFFKNQLGPEVVNLEQFKAALLEYDTHLHIQNEHLRQENARLKAQTSTSQNSVNLLDELVQAQQPKPVDPSMLIPQKAPQETVTNEMDATNYIHEKKRKKYLETTNIVINQTNPEPDRHTLPEKDPNKRSKPKDPDEPTNASIQVLNTLLNQIAHEKSQLPATHQAPPQSTHPNTSHAPVIQANLQPPSNSLQDLDVPWMVLNDMIHHVAHEIPEVSHALKGNETVPMPPNNPWELKLKYMKQSLTNLDKQFKIKQKVNNKLQDAIESKKKILRKNEPVEASTKVDKSLPDFPFKHLKHLEKKTNKPKVVKPPSSPFLDRINELEKNIQVLKAQHKRLLKKERKLTEENRVLKLEKTDRDTLETTILTLRQAVANLTQKEQTCLANYQNLQTDYDNAIQEWETIRNEYDVKKQKLIMDQNQLDQTRKYCKGCEEKAMALTKLKHDYDELTITFKNLQKKLDSYGPQIDFLRWKKIPYFKKRHSKYRPKSPTEEDLAFEKKGSFIDPKYELDIEGLSSLTSTSKYNEDMYIDDEVGHYKDETMNLTSPAHEGYSTARGPSKRLLGTGFSSDAPLTDTNFKLLFIGFYHYHFKKFLNPHPIPLEEEERTLLNNLRDLLNELQSKTKDEYVNILNHYVDKQISSLTNTFEVQDYENMKSVQDLMDHTIHKTETFIRQLKGADHIQKCLAASFPNLYTDYDFFVTDLSDILRRLATIYKTNYPPKMKEYVEILKNYIVDIYPKYTATTQQEVAQENFLQFILQGLKNNLEANPPK